MAHEKNEWLVEVPTEAVEELAKSFGQGPIINDEGRRLLEEHLVANFNGLKIEIFANEHPPPHFRVKYGGEIANYSIKDCSQLNGGLKKWYGNIKKWHSANKSKLIEIWDQTRPSDCPVGKYRDQT